MMEIPDPNSISRRVSYCVEWRVKSGEWWDEGMRERAERVQTVTQSDTQATVLLLRICKK